MALKLMDFVNMFKSITVEPITLLYMLAIFAEMPALQDMIFSKMCYERVLTVPNKNISLEQSLYLCDRRNFKRINHSDHSTLDDDVYNEIKSSYATYWGSYYQSILFASSILACIYTGSWSDIFGRKFPIIFPPLLSFAAQLVFMACAVNYFNWNWTGMILTGALLSGITGGSSSVVANSFGYITDITPVESRTKRIVCLESMLFAGQSLGSLLTGSILKNYQPVCEDESSDHPNIAHASEKYLWCFGAIALINLTIVIYAWLRIENTRSNIQINRRTITERIFNCTMLLDGIRCVFKPRPKTSSGRSRLLLLITAAILCFFGLGVQITLLFTFTKDQLNWSTPDYAKYQTIEPLVAGTALILLPVVMQVFGFKPRDTVLSGLGFVSRVCGFALMGFAQSWDDMTAVIVLFTFANYAVPMVRSMISKIIEPNERGKVFSFLACSQSLVHFVGGYLFPAIYKASLAWFPGLSFEVVAAMQLIALVIIIYLHFTSGPSPQPVTSEPNEENQ